MHQEIQDLVSQLQLQPHPEGGFYRETYRSPISVPVSGIMPDESVRRSLSTAILFLITSGNFSAFHRIKSDECWHFYRGRPLCIHQLSPEGDYKRILLGNLESSEQVCQYVVPAGYWFASETWEPNSYALVGCTVAPGFDFADFELANGAKLSEAYPAQAALIKQLTRI